jgi:hypothetical protein
MFLHAKVYQLYKTVLDQEYTIVTWHGKM